MSVGDELQRLAQLRDQGVLNQQEFEREKARLLEGGQAAAAPVKKRSSIVTGCGGAVVIVIVLAVIGAVSKHADKEVQANSSDASPAVVSITATELFNAYHANEVAAQSEYGKGPLVLTGTIDSIDLDFMNNTVIHLRTPNEFMSAGAQLSEASKDKASSLSKGDTIKLLCTGETHLIMGSPQLSDCEIE